MANKVFTQLCYTLKHLHLLKHDRHISSKEALVMCLHILSYSAVVLVISKCFQFLVDTTFTHFKCVLNALCYLAKGIIKIKHQGGTQPEIRNNPIFFHIFFVRNLIYECLKIDQKLDFHVWKKLRILLISLGYSFY